jgi:hypothetical protein
VRHCGGRGWKLFGSDSFSVSSTSEKNIMGNLAPVLDAFYCLCVEIGLFLGIDSLFSGFWPRQVQRGLSPGDLDSSEPIRRIPQ